MSDLTYDVQALRDLGQGLSGLAADLRSDGGLGDVSASQVNSSEVADALEDFAGDWDDKRETLARSLDSISDLATTAADTFAQTDADIADEVRDIFEEQQG